MAEDFTHYYDTESTMPEDLSESVITVAGRISCMALLMGPKNQEEMNAFKERMADNTVYDSIVTGLLEEIRMKAFGSAKYSPKSPDEHRRFFIAALRQCLNMVEEE